MSNEYDNTTATTTQPGPTLLEERTLAGIFVHFLGLGTGFVLPALVYLVAEHEFTRENARNAFNWQVVVTGAFAIVMGLLGAAIAIDSTAPEDSAVHYLSMAFLIAAAIGFSGFTLLVLANVAFGLIAMGNAIVGSAWRYPLAPDTVGRLSASVGDDVDWWKLLAVHVVVTPLAGAYLAWVALEHGAETGPTVSVGAGLVVALLLTSVLTPGLLVRDIRAVAATDTSWRPNWVVYVGAPAGLAALAYVAAAVQFNSGNPPGDAIYAFAGALWIAVVVYLFRRYRQNES